MDKLYAKALDELAHKDGAKPAELVKRLREHLEATGREKLIPGILRELKILEARRVKLAPTVEVASEKEAHAALKEAKEAGIIASKVHVNHSLIKGWRARSGGKLVDLSAKQGLIELYRKVTN